MVGFLPHTNALVSFRHETAPTATSVWTRSISKGWETLRKGVRASERAVASSGAALKSGWPHVRANDVQGERLGLGHPGEWGDDRMVGTAIDLQVSVVWCGAPRNQGLAIGPGPSTFRQGPASPGELSRAWTSRYQGHRLSPTQEFPQRADNGGVGEWRPLQPSVAESHEPPRRR